MSIVKKNKSGIFLIELMAVVLIILLTITTCVSMFFKSQKLSDKSYILTNACIQTENAVQLLKHDRGKIDSLQSYYKIEGNTVYFDKNFSVCEKGKALYKMQIIQNSNNNKLITSDIKFLDAGSEKLIYNLITEIFGREGDSNE